MFTETISKETAENLALLGRSRVLDDAYLAGGTALALQIGHRVSYDLDFFTQKKFKPQVIIKKISQIKSYYHEKVGEGTILGRLGDVKFSFFYYPYPLLFETKKYAGVFLADERDIGAMKVQAISDRGSKKDFVDLFVLLKIYPLKELLDFFHKKYEKFNYNQLHILKSLSYFYDADTNLEPVYIHPISWTEVKKFIRKVVDEYIKFQS